MVVADQRLKSFFERDDLRPGCYDDPAFVEIEATNPIALEDYARHVLTRKRTPDEDKRTRLIVDRLTQKLLDDASPNELLGQCMNISLGLMRILDVSGVWSFVVPGSARFSFGSSTGIDPSWLWIRDRADFKNGFAGHAWVVAPPFPLVDCTLRSQRWMSREAEVLPDRIVEAKVDKIPFEDDLWASPEFRVARPDVRPTARDRDLWGWLPNFRVSKKPYRVAYSPASVTAPKEGLYEVEVKIGGRQIGRWFDSARGEIIPL